MKRDSLVAATVTMMLVWSSGSASAQEAQADAAASATTAVQPSARGLFDEPAPIRKGLEFGLRRIGVGGEEMPPGRQKRGFYPEMGNMVTGAGWISAGVGYRHFMFGDRAFIDASTGLSWRAFKMAQARFEVMPFDHDRVSVGVQARWQDLTQVTYYGEGPDSLEEDRSEYRLKSVNTVGYGIVRPREWLEVHGRLGWLFSPELRHPSGSFLRGNPSTAEVFPGDPVFRVDDQPDYLHSEAAVVIETRDEPGYPTRGGVYRAALAHYGDQGAERFTFNRYEAEAAHFVPFGADANFVLAVRGWVVGTTTAPGQHVPFYLMPSLGGNNTLRGYSDYRFHDRNLAMVSTELRVALYEHIDVVGMFESGNVAARFGDLNVDKRAYGVGVRLHTPTTTVARLDLARSDEGWHVVFRMNDPMRLLSRFGKKTAQVPFVP